MTDEALAASQRECTGCWRREGVGSNDSNRRLQKWVDTDRAIVERLHRKATTDNARVKRAEFRFKLDRIALAQLKKEVQARTREVEARTRELGEIGRRLHATRSSTSFLVGSTLVNAARRPLALWKLPFQMLRLYRSKSRPATGTVVPEVTGIPHTLSSEAPKPVLKDTYPDPSQFLDFPLLSIPEAGEDGPPMAAILDTFTEHALRHMR